MPEVGFDFTEEELVRFEQAQRDIAGVIRPECAGCSTPKAATRRLGGMVVKEKMNIEAAQSWTKSCAGGLTEETIGNEITGTKTIPVCHHISPKNTEDILEETDQNIANEA